MTDQPESGGSAPKPSGLSNLLVRVLTALILGPAVIALVLLAGLESISGAVVAGIIVGVGESWAAAYLDPYTEGAMSQAFPYVLMLIVLIIRPQGLFGWKIIERV